MRAEVLLHSLSDDADSVVVDVQQVYSDEMNVVSPEIMEEDWDFQRSCGG